LPSTHSDPAYLRPADLVGIVGKSAESPGKQRFSQSHDLVGIVALNELFPHAPKNQAFCPCPDIGARIRSPGGGCVSTSLNAFPLNTTPQGVAEKKFIHAALLSR
jgi:hypothetical protein